MTKYLKLFTSNYERDGYENSDNYLEPYVSIVNGGGRHRLLLLSTFNNPYNARFE